jgi:hypothetical protein
MCSPHITAPRSPQGGKDGGASHLQPLPICPESVVGNGSRVLLLGSGGTLYCSRLMSWQERLRTLQQLGKWGLGLWLGLEFYRAQLKGANSQPSSASSNKTTSAGGKGRSQAQPQTGGKQTANSGRSSSALAQQLNQWLLSLMLGYISTVLSGLQQGPQGRQVVELCATAADMTMAAGPASCVARVAVDLCLLIPGSVESTLFTRVYPQFHAAGCAGPLLEAIERRIMSDQIQVLAPEVVQVRIH